MNDKNHIKSLFERLLDGTISEKELQILLNHIRTGGAESDIKSLMDSHWAEISERWEELDPALGAEERFEEVLSKLDVRQKTAKANQNRKNLARIRTLKWISVAASLLLLISLGIYWWANISSGTVISPVEQVASVNFSGKQLVHLPDGSKVILNNGSELSYFDIFGRHTREVQFSGEGYFDIAHDPDRPFIVHTGDVKTTVLGTAFNLMAYRNQEDVVVTVTRGKVAVGDEKQVFENILPSEQLVVDKQTRSYQKEEADLDKVLAWQKDFLILDGITVEHAAEMIGKKHHVDIHIGNEKIKNCRINASFMKGESLDQIMRVVCAVLQAEYTIQGNEVNIQGGRKCE